MLFSINVFKAFFALGETFPVSKAERIANPSMRSKMRCAASFLSMSPENSFELTPFAIKTDSVFANLALFATNPLPILYCANPQL